MTCLLRVLLAKLTGTGTKFVSTNSSMYICIVEYLSILVVMTHALINMRIRFFFWGKKIQFSDKKVMSTKVEILLTTSASIDLPFITQLFNIPI